MKGLPRHEHYKDSGVSWIEEIPFSWRTERAKWLFQRMERPIRPEDGVVTAFRNGQVTLRKNRREEGFTNALQEHGYQGIRKGDLVIHAMDAFAGAIGVSDSDGKSTPVYSACIPRDKYYVNNYYYAYLLRYMSQSGFIQALAKGIRERSTDFRFNDFANLWLPIPSREEQDKIVSFLDQKTAEIDEAIDKKQRLIELLKEQKAILIDQAVTKGLNPNVPVRGSGIEWMGEIPLHWEAKRLSYLAHLLQTGPFGSQLHQEEYIEDGIPVINPSQLFDGRIKPDRKVTVTEKTSIRLARHKLASGDVVFARRGEMGRCGLTAPEQAGWLCGTGSILFRPNKKFVYPQFAVIALGCNFIKANLEYVSVGSTMDNLNTSILSKISIPIPPLGEQQKIIDHIRVINEDFDFLINRELKIIEMLYKMKQVVTSQAVTGKIKV